MTANVSSENPRGNLRALGSLWIAYALFRLAMAILLALYAATATVMFGALLSRVAEPYTLMAIFHVLYIGLITVTALSGVVGLFAGLVLLAGNSSARILSLTAAFLSLSNLPLGTTLGIYTLVTFLP